MPSLSLTMLSHLHLHQFCILRNLCLRLRLQPRFQKLILNVVAQNPCAIFLQWLNAAPAAREPDSAKSFHLFMNLTCVSDCPWPYFPRESLYSQWEYLTRNAAQHPTWCSAVRLSSAAEYATSV